jgi:predicted CXXCH cytochrome family protein
MKLILRAIAATLLAGAWQTAAAQPSSDVGAADAGEQPAAVVPPPESAVPPEDTSCVKCHGESELWEGDRRKLHVTLQDLGNDIHWQKGLRCHDCHGGDASTTNFLAAHTVESGFRPLKSPADVPGFCGHCHSDIEYMRRFRPSARTDQVAEYWTSGHGQRLKSTADPNVATCVSCHGGHGIRPVNDPQSPVYPTRVAKTCSTCHSDSQLMADRQYHGRPLGHDQYELWSQSVHADALLKKNELTSATCNDCHGNHGAVPPEVGSVANACGTCHVKVAELFETTRMKHRFEQLELPGCAACHGNHQIRSPTDEMLGMGAGAVCARCHAEGKFGATLAGAKEARQMREQLEELKRHIMQVKSTVARAERLGMEVRGPRFDLHKAETSLTNARSLIHGFALAPMKQTLDDGLQVTAEVKARADEALAQYTYRRVWLALSVAPILLVVILLLMYIRILPSPDAETS